MNRVMNGSIRVSVVLAMIAVLAESVAATTIEYLGTDTVTKEAWRSTATSKAASVTGVTGADPNGDNAYGSDGYYVAWKDVTTGNGSGVDVKSSLPSSYISSVTGVRTNTYYNADGYAKLDDPSLAIASTVDNLPSSGVWQTDAAGTFDFFTVTLAKDTTFVLTTILGNHDGVTSNANAIKVTSSDDATGVTQLITAPDASPEYAFFKLTGKAGQTFTITLTGNAGNVNTTTAGIAFESAVPEPSTTVMIISGIAGLLAYAWRKRR